MKKLSLFILLCLTLSACGNLADKRVAELRALTEKVERRGERFTTKEWKETDLQYEQLVSDFDDLELTEAQADTVYYLKQRYRKACVHSSREAAQSVVDEVVTDALDEVSGIADDIVYGVSDYFSADSLDIQ